MSKRVGRTNKTDHYRLTHSYWESRAKQYPEEPKRGVVDAVISTLRKAKVSKILDVGSGPAHYAIRFAKTLGCHVLCLDFSKEMVKKARENVGVAGLGDQFDFLEGNLLAVSLPEKEFDAVTFISVLHYLLPADIEVALQKSYRFLKPGGKLVIVEYWVNEDLTEVEQATWLVAEHNRMKRGVQATFLKEDNYIRLLKQAGFQDVAVCYVSEMIYLEKYFRMNPDIQPSGQSKESIRVAVFEATK